jgi:cytochrome c-type biogenesis protein CcmH
MSYLVAAAAALVVVVLAVLLIPLLSRRRAEPGADDREAPLAALRRQRQEIEEDFGRGALSAEERDAALADLVHRAGEEVPADAASPQKPLRATRPVWIAGALVLVPLIAVALYLKLGNPAAMDAPLPPHGTSASGKMPMDLETAVEMLAKKMADRPNDAEGWALLGRSYYALNRFPDAVAAFEKADRLKPDDPAMLADYADALGMVQGRNLSGKPKQLIERALKLDPHLQKGLALAASAEMNEGRMDASLAYWQRLKSEYPPNSEAAKQIDGVMDEIRTGSAGAVAAAPAAQSPGPAAAKPSSAPASAASAGTSVSGVVNLAGDLKGKVGPDDTLFIYARAVEGSRMPLAILRLSAKELPKRFSLDDSMGMGAGPKLSETPQVRIEARVSKSGTAMSSAGDLEGSSKPVKPGASDVAVLIDRVVQ